MISQEAPVEPAVKLLLVEDDPNDAELTGACLARVDGARFDVETADSYEAGLEAIRRGGHDVYLIDYRLGPRDGTDLIREARQGGCVAPLILLTGQGTRRLDADALRAGASDYLVKDALEPDLLGRSIRYALERRRLLCELEEARQRQAQEQELRSLDALAVPSGMAVTAGALGLAPLRESLPEVFDDLVRQFAGLMDHALEQRAFRVDHDVNRRTKALAEQVGGLRGGPADVVDVYGTALKQKLRGVASARAQALMEEGRTMVLGVMGYLASFYRACCFNQVVPGERRAAPGAGIASAGNGDGETGGGHV